MGKPAPDAKSMTIGLQNFITPTTVFDLDLKNLQLTKRCQVHDVLVDTSHVKTEHLKIPSTDGSLVPATVHYNSKVLKDLSSKPEAPLPTLISFYAGFGVSDSDMFDPAHLAIVNNIQGIWV